MFLTLVEDKSHTTQVYLLSDKAAVPGLVKEFVIHVRTQFNTKIKVVRTDNGTKFCNKMLDDFLKDLGIVHQLICAYTPTEWIG